MKKLKNVLLTIILVTLGLCGGMANGVFAQNEAELSAYEQEMFLEMLNEANDEESIINLIDENLWAVEGLSQYEYYAQSEQIRYETAKMLRARGFDSFEYFIDCFESSVVISRINNVNGYGEYEGFIYEYNELLDLDLHKFERLKPNMKMRALQELYMERPFWDKDKFRYLFEDIVWDLWSAQKTSSGSSSGGAGFKGIKCYLLTPSGEKIEEEPEKNSEVKIVVQATLMVEPGVTYGVAVYGEDGILKCVRLFESEATQSLQHDFLELETLYDSADVVKVFTLDSENILKPLREAMVTNMCWGEELPVAEQETEGLTAYKGMVNSVGTDIFTFSVNEIRSFGYWSDVIENPTNLTVEYSGYDVWFYNLFGELTCTIKNVDDRYILDNIKANVDGEILSFNGSDVISASNTGITVEIDGVEKEYSLSPQIELFENTSFVGVFTPDYFDCEDGLYTMLVSKNGEIKRISLKYVEKDMQKVSTVWADGFDTENGMYVSFDEITLVGDEPVEGDVVEMSIYEDSISVKVIEPVYATVCEEGVEIDGKEYEVDSWSEQFAPGESCLAYLYTGTKRVGYIEKNYDNKELIIITGISVEEDNSVELRTTTETITLGAEICFDGRFMESEELLNLVGESVIPAYYEKGNVCDILEPIEQAFSGSARYRRTEGTFTPSGRPFSYFLKDSAKFIVIDYEGEGYEFDKSWLNSDGYYDVEIYSNDWIFADVIVFSDVSKTSRMVISKIEATEYKGEFCEEIFGYSDGKELKLINTGNSVQAVAQVGDVISVRYTIDNEINSISVVASFSRDYCQSTGNSADRYLIGELCKISGDIISLMDRNGNINTMRIIPGKYLYVYYPQEGVVEVENISAIRNVANVADRMFVHSTAGAVNFAVIVKE